jgi:two-component system phosphate regulon sensor histidine kinase PhoR
LTSLIERFRYRDERSAAGPDLRAPRAASARVEPTGSSLGDAAALVIESLPLPALIVDEDLYLRAGNALAHELFGSLRTGSLLAFSVRSPEVTTALRDAFSGTGRSRFDLLLPLPSEGRLEGNVSRLGQERRDTSRSIAIVVFQDHSERDALARMRMEFVANASHELRTPLAVLSGFIETLSGAAKDDVGARERFLRIMGEQAARMTRLVDDLLLLSRVEMRSHLQPTSMADLNLVANDAARQVRQAAADAEIVVTSSVSEGAAKVRGDHDELVQAVQNLIQNAVKYGKPGGRVDVLVGEGRGRRGREVRIAVRDEGPGIAPEHVPRLTERFYRVSTNESREKGGTGLGLAIVKHIVTRHAGSIDIQSEVGKGSMFTIAIPAAA